ncbi:MAG TPA: toxin TcdB middle/N-terminal domain-containing protein [Verrucomicrobiae bacterium]|nr:toxin TcdB middle/N-terminal domain-containing protein [Verrucomicrobiae bacterium]
MKANQKFIGLVFIGFLAAQSLRAGSLTDYGAIPQLTQPPQNQLNGNQKLDFHTDLFTGRFGYQVPIEVPPARGDSEPSVALQYNSANKNGWCGVGWDLDMGYIQRETRYGVPVSGGAYSDNYGFVFSFGGHSGRLVNTGSSNYCAQINTDFLKFTYAGGVWIATDKDGRKYKFGETTASRIATTLGTFKWGLSSTSDPNGNQGLYSYTNDSGQLYLHEIDYNGNTNSPAIATNCAVVFDLTNRADGISSALSGVEIRTAKLLSGVRVFNQGQQVRRYALAYTVSPSTGRELLHTVTQYGTDNTTALPPQTFTYSVQQTGFASPVLWPIVSQTSTGDPYGISPSTPDAQLIDMNGDGLPDRVVHPYAQSYFLIQYNLGPSSGFSGQYVWSPVGNETSDSTTPWMNLDSANSHMIDMNGDGLPDRVIDQHDPPRSHFQIQFNTGSGFASSIYDWNNVLSVYPNYEGYTSDALNVPYALSIDDVSSLTTLTDMNGDGLPDRVIAGSAAGRFDVQLNLGNAFSSSVQAWNNVTLSGIRTDSYYAPRSRDNNYVYSDLIDMNGDGLPDRVIDSGSPNYIIEAQINNGVNGFGSPESWNLSGAYPGEIDTVNGANYVQLVDMNGDGLPDLVYLPSYGGGVYYVYINTGTGFSSAVTWSGVTVGGLGMGGDAPQAWDANGTRAEMIDINGDGLPDRVMRYPNTSGSPTDYLEVQYNLGPFPDLLTTVSNGIGGSVNAAYQPSTIYRNPDGSSQKMNFPVYVVSSVIANDGRGNSGTNSYVYSGAYYDTTYKEFRGFYEAQETDPLGAITLTYFHQGGGWNGSADGETGDDVAESGMPFRIDNFGSDSKLYSRTMNLVGEYLTYNGGGGFYNAYFPFIQQTLKMDYEGNSTPRVTAVGYAYDSSNGNMLSQTNYGEVTGVNLAAQTFSGITGTPPPVYRFYTYATIGSNPDIVDKPASITVSSDSSGSTVLQQSLFSYFAVTGDLKQKCDLICPSTYATNAYTVDNYGNVATTTDPIGIVNTVNYDSTATFPVRKYIGTLADNLIDYTLYDLRSGELLAETNEQGLVTANLYDVFFRFTNSATSTTPNGAATLWRKQVRYGLGGIVSNNSSNYVRLWENDPSDTVNGYHETYTYLDGFGRSIQTRDEAETNGYRVSDLVYDRRGAVMLETYPIFSSGGGYTKPSGTRTNVYTQYDPIGRQFKINPCASASFNSSGWLSGTPTILAGDTGSPVGSTSIAYKDGTNPWAIVVTNALGKIHKYELDAFGRTNQIIEVTSAGNFTTALNYNLVDDLTNIVDNAGNQISFFVDDLGNEVAMADPDMGFWQFARDADGNVKVQTDPKGQQIRFYRDDPAGRITRREGWNAAHQLVSTNLYLYDSNGGDSAYTVYPGQLFEVMDDEGWQKNSFDVRNRTPKTARYLSKNGNTYTTQSTFDDADRQNSITYPNGGPTITNLFDTGENLSQVKLVGGAGTVFYAAKGFNAMRQLLGVNFGNGVVTSNTYYAVSLRLQKITTSKSGSIQNLGYTYDALNDVLGIVDGVYSGLASASFGNIQYDDLSRLTFATNASGGFAYGFDSINNILTNQEFGNLPYTYGTGGIRPHCVRTANGQRYTYDLDGNTVFRGLQRLDYDVNNHLNHVINTNGVVTAMGYAFDEARLWEQSGTNALQVWIGGYYEEKNGQVLYHVLAAGKSVCTFDSTGTNVFEYYHADILTSTAIQTDQNGNEIQNYGYFAFGQSRYTQSSTVFKVSRRYTGQIFDDATGLYYYNARYYDPQLGRFTQPDDIIPDLSNPQTYNRYAYCVNNPLRYTDPSGNDALDYLGGGVAGIRGSFALNDMAVRLGAQNGKNWGDYNQAAADLGIGKTTTAGNVSGIAAVGNTTAGAANAYLTGGQEIATAGIATAPILIRRAGQAITRSAEGEAATQSIERGANKIESAADIGKPFTRAQKRDILNANRLRNEGELRSDLSGEKLVPAQKSVKGITPPQNEAQVDHIIPRSKGGQNTTENAQVLSRQENRAKSNKMPSQ